ncbi:TolC family protein [Burkholderia ubonensis]|uniref:TolC family protein n=1 Tax=Burkholderia ubonensis TaxID=101571 RepID=UPI000AF697A5|nr:TolC family protein [Burkholderia ubonensis]
MSFHHQGINVAYAEPQLERKPIAWLVASLFALAPFTWTEESRAQGLAGMRSHTSVSEWAVGPAPATVTVASRDEAALAAQVREDERKRLAEIATAEGQARLAEEARRNEEARLRSQAQAEALQKQLREAQAREAQRIADAARDEEARLREAARAEAERATARERQRAEQARAAQAAQLAAERKAAEDRRRDMERQAEENRQLAAKMEAAEAARRAEAERAAAAEAMAREAETRRREAEERAVAAEREAAARAEEARQQAEAEQARAAAEAVRLQAQRVEDARREVAAARPNHRADVPAPEVRVVALEPENERTPAAQVSGQDEWALAFKPVTRNPSGSGSQQSGAASQNVLTIGKTGGVIGAPNPLASEAALAVQSAGLVKQFDAPGNDQKPTRSAAASAGKASPAPTSGTPGQFARWLETQSDDFGMGPTPSSAELKRIIWGAVKTAAERSPEVRQAYANFQASNADVLEAKGQRWPQVDIGSQSPSLNFGPGRGGSNPANLLSATVTTNVFDWGRTKHTIGSREHLSNAAERAYEAALASSANEVSTTLIELGKQRNIVDLSQQFVDRMSTLVRMLGEIVEVDRGRGSELTQAKTRLLQAQAQRDTAEARVRDAELTLRKLVGDEAVLIPRTRTWSIEPGNLPRLLSQVDVHPALQQVRSEADAADLNAKAVKAAGLPQVNWVVSAGMGKDAAGQRQPWQTMLTLNWGAFRGGSAKAQADAASQRASASWQRMEQQRRDLEYAVRTADQDAHTMLQRADLYQGLSAETDRVRKAFFEQWYHLGKRTLLDVLTAENEHYGNRVAEVTNRFDAYTAVFREHHAAGSLTQWLSGEVGS